MTNPSSPACIPYLSSEEKRIFFSAAIAAVIAKGLTLIGQPIPHRHPKDLLGTLKAKQFDKQDQPLVDLVIVMLNPRAVTTLLEVRAFIKHAKETISKLEGNFEALQAIAKFEELSEGY
jgi:hypothetical protein